MQVIINEKRMEIPNDNVLNLNQILPHITELIPDGEVIQSLAINNKLLEPNWAENAETIYLLDEDKILVTTSHTNNIAEKTLKNAIKYLAQIIQDFTQCSDLYRQFEDAQANKKYAVSIDNLQLFFRIIEDSNKLRGKSLDQYKNDKISYSKMIPELHQIFQEMLQAQESEDWIQLADLIEYELLERLKLIEKNYDIFFE